MSAGSGVCGTGRSHGAALRRDRVRADQRLVELGLAPSRTKAQALILAGEVMDADGHLIVKPGEAVAKDRTMRLRGEPVPYVSRGGLKLAGALDSFDLDVEGRIALDVGASTGGFTDCLLQRGAERVYALDVGYNQLAWSLRQDPRVVVHERLNIRDAPLDLLPERVDLIVVDVSFISLHLVLPAAMAFADVECDLVALIKPQFEVGPERVGKGGIVRDEKARGEAVESIRALIKTLGLIERGISAAVITGTKGNQEFLIHGQRSRLSSSRLVR